jgi:hypothetical protein
MRSGAPRRVAARSPAPSIALMTEPRSTTPASSLAASGPRSGGPGGRHLLPSWDPACPLSHGRAAGQRGNPSRIRVGRRRRPRISSQAVNGPLAGPTRPTRLTRPPTSHRRGDVHPRSPGRAGRSGLKVPAPGNLGGLRARCGPDGAYPPEHAACGPPLVRVEPAPPLRMPGRALFVFRGVPAAGAPHPWFSVSPSRTAPE